MKTTIFSGKAALAAALSLTSAVALGALVTGPAVASSSASAPSVIAPATSTVDNLQLEGLRSVTAFDTSAGQVPENIAPEPGGSVLVTLLGNMATGQGSGIVRVWPSGAQSTVLALPDGAMATGIVRAANGTIYFNDRSSNPDLSGIWKLEPGRNTPVKVASLPVDAFPNGLALDPVGGNLYTADTALSTVWKIPASGGAAERWISGPEFTQVAPSPNGFGANGLKIQNGAVWVSNTDQGTIMRIGIGADGQAGQIETVATGLQSIDDFSFVGRSETIIAALNFGNRIMAVYPDGSSQALLTETDGLSTPTSTFVSGNKVYITNANFLSDPNNGASLQVAKIKPAFRSFEPLR